MAGLGTSRRIFHSSRIVFDKMNLNSPNLPQIFLPPVNRSMQILDRSFFQKSIPLTAATILDDKNISPIRAQLQKSGDLLSISPIRPLRSDETLPGRKCMLLRPEIEFSDPMTWSNILVRIVEEKLAVLRRYNLTMAYEDWTMHNILEAILPEFPEDERETPAGFSQVGHVAHLNLREQYLPYKTLIGQILLDKNVNVTTVINKTEDVGTDNVFRTFPYEVLAGPDNMDVTLSESDCEFKFNFGKVYWNTRLNTEHSRLINKFKEGEAVCDVMAGVGPFAVPAGKRKVFVRANDLNPDSFHGLEYAITRNKVQQFVSASCVDGREFIRTATKSLSNSQRRVELNSKPTWSSRNNARKSIPKAGERNPTIMNEPTTFDHYVMNLPASAVEFLDAFRGVYAGRQMDFQSRTLPLVHVYCFSPKLITEEEEFRAVRDLVSQYLGSPINPDSEVHYVRLISPKKKMFCISFRLPEEVAFGDNP